MLIELFSPAHTIEALWEDIGRNRGFRKGVGHYERKFQGKQDLPPTTVGVRKLESLTYYVALFVWSFI